MPNVRVFPDPEMLSQALVAHIQELTETTDEPLKAALSGGSSPVRAYELLAASDVDRAKLKLFLVDERFVPPTDVRSNERLVVEKLFPVAPCPTPGAFEFHPMYREGSPSDAAEAYDAVLRQEVERFDLIILGMGEDGHTASIFPGRWPDIPEGVRCVASKAPVVAEDRITLTPAPICEARETIFIVTGSGKAELLNRVLHGPDDFESLPSQYIDRHSVNAQWWIDEAAKSW